jgi:rare lipoprotein A
VLAADPADAGDAVDLARAIGRSDRAMVARYRTAVRRLEAQAGRVATEKRGLAARERDLAARRVVTRGDLAAARRRAAARARRAAATQAVSVPLAATAAWGLQAPFTPGPVARPNEGGLPAEVVSARSLPGTLLTDAAGRPQVAAPVSTPTAGAPPVVAVPDGTVIPGAQAAPALTTLVASWYGDELRGSATANGERFDPGAMTAAHKTLPFGTLLRVTLGSRWVVVRVNDRGPYVAGRDLDLSQAAAQAVGLGGVGPVQVEVLPGTAAGG